LLPGDFSDTTPIGVVHHSGYLWNAILPLLDGPFTSFINRGVKLAFKGHSSYPSLEVYDDEATDDAMKEEGCTIDDGKVEEEGCTDNAPTATPTTATTDVNKEVDFSDEDEFHISDSDSRADWLEDWGSTVDADVLLPPREDVMQGESKYYIYTYIHTHT
jgi:hypothetical protein